MDRPILIAEDYEDDAIAIRDTFQVAGIVNPIIWVKDGTDVLTYLKGEAPYQNRQTYPLPEVLLLDLKMPRMTGLEVLRWLAFQPEFKKLLKIVLSGHEDLKEVTEAYQLGAHSFLLKPCHTQDIVNLAKAFPQKMTVQSFSKFPTDLPPRDANP
jgi:CheY-like chemotaxis protein